MKRRLLLLCFSPLERDPRVLRQLRLFKDEFEVSTCGFGPAPEGAAHHYEIPLSASGKWPTSKGVGGSLLLARQFADFYKREPRVNHALASVPQDYFDVVLANDLNTVPLALMLRPKSGVHADLHEWEPRVPGRGPVWTFLNYPYIRWQLRQLPKVNSATTVAQGIAEAYERQYGLHCEVVTNAADFADLPVTPVGRPIRIIHSGGTSRARGIDVMIDAMRGIENATLDLMLVSDGTGILEELKEHASGMKNVTFRDPVRYSELVSTLGEYDVGVHLLAPSTFNNKMALPNKFFEYVQARLAVLIGPSPEMARLARDHDFGIVLDGFTAEALHEAIASLTQERVEQLKKNSDAAAYGLAAERAVQPWLDAVRVLSQ